MDERQAMARSYAAVAAYWRTRDGDRLRVAIDTLEETLRSHAFPLRRRGEVTSLLCGLLLDRFESRGDLRDLESSVARMRQVIEETPMEDEAYPSYLQNLGLALQTRFQRVLDPVALDEAIDCHTRAIEIGRQRGRAESIWENNLANALRLRAHLDHDLPALRQAIELHEEVLRRTPIESPDSAVHRANLGADLLDLYSWAGETRDPAVLARATEILHEAVSVSGFGLPADLTKVLSHLSQALIHAALEESSLDSAALARLSAIFRRAVIDGAEHAPSSAMRNAVNWGNWAFARREWAEAVEAFEQALRLVRELIGQQTDRATKMAWL
jgi:tetratricopeptide (TPR) repeat protein